MSSYSTSRPDAFDHTLPEFKALLRETVVHKQSCKSLQVEGQIPPKVRCQALQCFWTVVCRLHGRSVVYTEVVHRCRCVVIVPNDDDIDDVTNDDDLGIGGSVETSQAALSQSRLRHYLRSVDTDLN